MYSRVLQYARILTGRQVKGVAANTTYLTLKEAADYMACSVVTLRRRIRSGELTAYRSGRMIRVTKRDLDGMMESTARWAS